MSENSMKNIDYLEKLTETIKNNAFKDAEFSYTAKLIGDIEYLSKKIGEDQIFYCNQRGIDTEKAIALIVNGFSKEVLNKLPMEFAVEAQKLLEISLEGSVG